MTIGIVLGYVALPVLKSYSSLTNILQCCSELCHLQHGQQAFFRQNAAPSQIETHLRMKEARNEQGSRDRVVIRFRSLKLVLRYRLEAISECSSFTKAVTRLVYIQVTYHYLRLSLPPGGETTTPFKSSGKNNPPTSLENLPSIASSLWAGPSNVEPFKPLHWVFRNVFQSLTSSTCCYPVFFAYGVFRQITLLP